jgi:hypothetical protein
MLTFLSFEGFARIETIKIAQYANHAGPMPLNLGVYFVS